MNVLCLILVLSLSACRGVTVKSDPTIQTGGMPGSTTTNESSSGNQIRGSGSGNAITTATDQGMVITGSNNNIYLSPPSKEAAVATEAEKTRLNSEIESLKARLKELAPTSYRVVGTEMATSSSPAASSRFLNKIFLDSVGVHTVPTLKVFVKPISSGKILDIGINGSGISTGGPRGDGSFYMEFQNVSPGRRTLFIATEAIGKFEVTIDPLIIEESK